MVLVYASIGGAANTNLALWTITVSDSIDIDRGRWPILARIERKTNTVAQSSPGLLLVKQDQEDREPQPFQILTVHEPDVDCPRDVTSRSDYLEICFFAELSAGCEHRYELYETEPSSSPPPDSSDAPTLHYAGEGLGTTVNSGPAAFEFDPLSGQLYLYTPRIAGVYGKMGFQQERQRAIHWNPDVKMPPSKWGSTSEWRSDDPERTPDFKESRGRTVYRTVRSGYLPVIAARVYCEVSYTVFAGMPFMLEASRLRFEQEASVRAIRNNELVFSRGIHTHGAWPNKNGGPELGLLYDEKAPQTIQRAVTRLASDIPWIALLHLRLLYGISIVNLWHGSSAPPGSDGPQDHDAQYYFLDYGQHTRERRPHYDFAYVCRKLVGSATVPKGATYAERSAFLVFALDENEERRFDDMLRWTRLLQNPPVVVVE